MLARFCSEFRIYGNVTERVDLGKRGVCFPLKPAYDRANETLCGREDAVEIRQAAGIWTAYDEFGAERRCVLSVKDSNTAVEGEALDFFQSLQDSEETPSQVDSGTAGDSSVAAAPDKPEIAERSKRWFIDSIGWRFPADEYGQQIFA